MMRKERSKSTVPKIDFREKIHHYVKPIHFSLRPESKVKKKIVVYEPIRYNYRTRYGDGAKRILEASQESDTQLKLIKNIWMRFWGLGRRSISRYSSCNLNLSFDMLWVYSTYTIHMNYGQNSQAHQSSHSNILLNHSSFLKNKSHISFV